MTTESTEGGTGATTTKWDSTATKRRQYVQNLCVAWLEQNRPDVVNAARSEGYVKFPRTQATVTRELPESLARIRR